MVKFGHLDQIKPDMAILDKLAGEAGGRKVDVLKTGKIYRLPYWFKGPGLGARGWNLM